MDDRRGGDQPTVFSESAEAGPEGDDVALEAPSELAADAGALALPEGIARRTGVLFVHGIGTQPPNETFLDWSAPIVELLTDWRAARDGTAPPPPGGPDRIDDPVRRAEFSAEATSPPYLEIVVPAHESFPETTWVVTEAWWASDLRAPSLGRVVHYLRRRMRDVVSGIALGYRSRSPHLLGLADQRHVIDRDRPTLTWRMIEGLDHAQSRAFGARPVGWVLGSVGTVGLAGYDLLRRLPIPVVRDFAVRKMLDSFLVDWFGDLPVLLDEPVQAANVRARVARSIERLIDDGCDAIVIVAHSGGALVTFETLLDPAFRRLHVDKLITIGQGLGLAWRLATDPEVREIAPGHRLVGNLARAREGLRWVDVWASYDPAPAGPLPARSGIAPSDIPDPAVAAIVETGDEGAWLMRANVGTSAPTMEELVQAAKLAPNAPTITVESRPVTNEMNVLTDHGAYWANPEGFLIPLVRHIDAARGAATASRFFRDDGDRTRRVLWRRERVSALAAWGWICSLTAIASAAVLIGLQLGGDQRLTRAGDAIAGVWGLLPGHEIVTVPIEAAASVIGALLGAVGQAEIHEGLASLGPPVVALALLVVLFFALAKIGTGRWHDWDRRERRAMHRETVTLPDRSIAAGQVLLLVAGVAGLVLATFGAGQAAGLVIVLGAAAGLVVWAWRPLRSDP